MSNEIPTAHARRRSIVIVVIVALGVLIVATTASLALRSRPPDASAPPPQAGYLIATFLRNDITEEQKQQVESALRELQPVGDIQFETREDAWQRFKTQFTDAPELVEDVPPEAVQAAFRVTVPDAALDCTAFDRIRNLPGVDSVSVTQMASGSPMVPTGPIASCR